MDDLLKISGNEHAIDVLRQIIESREGIGFVGAGISAGLYPLWKQVLNKLAEEATKRGRGTDADKRFWLETLASDPLAAAQRIKHALGSSIYGSVLYDMFASRQDVTGKRYTPLHRCVVRMGLRAVVTTNYDPGILEARLTELPGASGTGWATSKDPDDLQRWLNDSIFARHALPILFAHGMYERTETIILANDEYRDAYAPGLYRSLFEKLWTVHRLIIIGYGFSDPWLRFICDQALWQTRASSGPRHVALIGFLPDQLPTPTMRAHFEDTYNTDVIFYPIQMLEAGNENHSALAQLLGQIGCPADSLTTSALVPSKVVHVCRQRWVHETTNDERYVGRRDAVEHLNRWTADPQVRLISVTAMGGQGKTALLGNWLKILHGDFPRTHEGIFFWSFYANRAVREFLNEYLEFVGWRARMALPEHAKARQVRLVNEAIEALPWKPTVIVLDGLEVLQERPGMSGYGRFLEDDLREFIESAARLDHGSLIILTSRFPFADLKPYLGSGIRNLDLGRLIPDDGAELLQRCRVGGTTSERARISQFLEGHPLALRIFAAALHTQHHGDPTRLWQVVFDRAHLRQDDPWESKLARLLQFYDTHLPLGQRTALAIVSLFGTPVEEPVVVLLVRKAAVPAADHDTISDLGALGESGLVLKEHTGGIPYYSCHPMVRDHFRQALIAEKGSIAFDAAKMLLDRPSNAAPAAVGEIIPTLNAIELLLEAEYVTRAHDLYERRLLDGEVFLMIPAVHEGQRCAASFVSTKERRILCRDKLRPQSIFRYLNKAGFFAAAAGEPSDAVAFYEEALQASRTTNNKVNMAIALRNLCAILTHLGRLSDARKAGSEAVNLLRGNERRPLEVAACLAELGLTMALNGRVDEALALFEEAEHLRPVEHSDYGMSIWPLRQAEILFRLGDWDRAKNIAKRCLDVSQILRWRHDYAMCQLVLAQIETQKNRFRDADLHFRQAETIFRSGHLLTDLPRLLIAAAELRMREDALDEAVRLVNEGLQIAAMRELGLAHADALTLRGRAILQRWRAGPSDQQSNDSVLRALDDGKDALRISRQSGYIWAEHQALALLFDVWTELGNIEEAYRCHENAQSLSQLLRRSGL